MTDTEIIKALECRIDNFSKSVFDLINRQKAEIQRITENFNCQQTVYADLSKIIKDQKAEIERLEKKANTPFAEVTFDENKLKEIVADAIENIEVNLNSVKSEAIKEFAEKLKENCYTYSDICGYQSTVVDVNHIDNLVKEMTEVN